MRLNIIFIIFIMFVIVILTVGCGTTPKENQISENEYYEGKLYDGETIDNVQTSFVIENYAGGLIRPPSIDKILDTAYDNLIEEARKNYSENINIVNIKCHLISQDKKFVPFAGNWGVYTYNATGDVIFE